MNVISVGDLHGKNCWKKIDLNRYDQIVFIGDYVDSEIHSNLEILSNLYELLRLKKTFPDKVVLLLGNHDIQYLYYPDYRCSRFRPDVQPEISNIFIEHRPLFQIAYQQGNYLWTHAGISKQWCGHHQHLLNDFQRQFATTDLASTLNAIALSSRQHHLHEVGPIRGGKQGIAGGITWADQSETIHDFIEGYHQIVGHTPVNKIVTATAENGSITYIDCLNTVEDYYSILLK